MPYWSQVALRPHSLFAGFLLLCSCSGKPAARTREPNPQPPPPAVELDAAVVPPAPAADASGRAAPDLSITPADAGVYPTGTTIPDTADNRAVLDAIEAYRQALERYDQHALIDMIHPDYSDSRSGSEVDHDQQVQIIESLAGRVRAISVRIEVQNLAWPTPFQVEVEVLIDASYDLGNAKRKLREQVLVVLRQHRGSWRFVSGM